MRALVEISLKLRVLLLAAAAALLVFGVRGATSMPLDVFPEFAPPYVEVQTEAPGLSTSEVEALVTMPIENALNGASWVKTVRSKSVPGLSAVVLIFAANADPLRARQLVQERLSVIAPHLPEVARPPVMLSPLSSTSRAMKIGVSSKKLSLIELSTLARFTIRPRLLAIPGVANVAIWGQRDRQFQVLVDPVRLGASGLPLASVVAAAADATRPAAGGFIDTPNQRIGIRQAASVHTTEQLGEALVERPTGLGVRLADVAQIVEGHQPMIGDAVINDAPGLLLIVEKQPWGNTLEVTRMVDSALLALRPALADVEIDANIFRPATFIERSIDNLVRAMWIGCLLVLVVLIAFLYEWRTALISALAIPLSIVSAVLLLRAQGLSINTMVIAGLVIALGEVVDDAIIDVDNIVRRLRENRLSNTPRPLLSVILSASLEVRGAIVYATLIVLAAFAPVFFMEGLSGSFFRPLAVSYGLAVLASMLVALTVTPALCAVLLGRGPVRRSESPLSLALHRRLSAILPRVLAQPRKVMLSTVAVLCLTFATVPLLGESFLPEFRETDFLMHWVLKPGSSHPEMVRITERASKELRKVPGVRHFGSHIGRAEVADEVVGMNFTELWISIDPDVDYESTVKKVQEIVDGYPGLYRDLLTYLKERIKEVLTGASDSIVVRLFGPDLVELRKQAEVVKQRLEGIKGVVDLKIEPLVEVPELMVQVDLPKAAALGVNAGQVREAVSTLVQGKKVGEVHEGERTIDVVVRGIPDVRSNVEVIRNLPIIGSGGELLRLSDVAVVRLVPSPNAIKRENASRRIDVACNVKGRDLGAVANDVKARLAGVTFASGYHPEVLGEYAERQAVSKRLQAGCLLALCAVFVLLQTSFGNLRMATLAFLTLPFALVGGIVAVVLTGGVLSLGSLVGLVTVLGIAARNGIMLLSHYQHLEHEEGERFGPSLVLRGTMERLTPILMTALTTALALVPLVVSGMKPGHEIEQPMAAVILGGLFTSTVLNLLVVPVLYLRFGAPRVREQ